MVNFVGIKRVYGVEMLDLPLLASGRDSNLTSDDMADLRCQDIAVDNDSNRSPENSPLPKLEEG